MTQRFIQYAALIFALSVLSGLVPLLRRWSDTQLQTLVSASAGLLLGILFLDLLPHAVAIPSRFFAASLVGFVLLLALEKFVLIHPHETHELRDRRSGWTAYFGISLHSLLDGVALGSSAVIPELGPLVLWAIVAHKIPNTFSLASILLYFGFTRRSTALLIVLFSLLTPIGGALAVGLLRTASADVAELAIGLASGTFLFIATSDLLPHAHAHHTGRYRNLFAVLLGIAIGYLAHRAHMH